MKLLALFMVVGSLHLSAASYSQTITLEAKGQTLKQVFNTIQKQTGYHVVYNTRFLNDQSKVDVSAKQVPLDTFLDNVLSSHALTYDISENMIMIGRAPAVPSHPAATPKPSVEVVQRTISGIVTDANGAPLEGVTVRLSGTNTATTTSPDGRYTLNIPSEGGVLSFSIIGYNSLTEQIGNRSALNITLEQSISDLDEVVVVGYGTQKKVNLTGSVDQISGDRLSALQVNTIGEALQGQVAGVNVDIADGKPGRSASFNIRGNTSINGGGPLVVIDGVPLSATELNKISPHDIEDISILKDAASTAIYGARASFGVILVTTKKGRRGGVDIQYNNFFGFSTPTIVPDIYDNPVDYLEINEWEFNGYIGQSYWTDAQVEYPRLVAADPSLPHAQVMDIGGRPNLLLGGKVYNYYEEWFNKFSPKQNHRVSVSGGDDKWLYYVSGDYNYEEGSLKFKPEKINRYSLRSNISYKINDNFTIFNNTNLVRRDEEQPNQNLYGFTSNVYRFIENSHPMMPEYVEIDGQMVPTDIGFYREFVEHNSGIENDEHETRSTLGLDMSFLNNDLKVRVDGTYHVRNYNRLRWWDNAGPYLSNSFNNRNIVLDYYSDAGPAKIYRSIWRDIRTNVNAYATYNKAINGHDFTIMAGFNQESYNYLYTYAEKIDPLQVPQNSLNLATGNSNVSDDDDRNASRSVFSRLNYNWQGKYLAEINASYFLTSRFSKDQRGHMFVAGSAAWRISEENFFSSLKPVVNELKVRGSFGSIGNANIGSYDYLPILNVGQSAFTLEGNRVNLTQVPAPKSANFTWETVETAGVGVDWGFLGNRLTGSFDYYQRTTRNMLANFRSLPSVFGAAVPKENVATLRNRGWETTLAWSDNFQLRDKNFSYNVRVNLSDYKSVIIDYYNPTNYLQDYYVGQNLGEIWGLNVLGYFQTDEEAQNGALLGVSPIQAYAAAGTIKFDDRDGSGVIDWGDRTLDNPGDYVIIGNTTPRYQYGISLGANWNGIDFNAFFRGIGKRDIYPGHEAVNFWGAYNRKYQAMPRHTVENRWTPENPDAYFPRPQGYLALGNRDLGENNNKYLQDASFLRLKNLTIGYTFSNPLPKAKVQSVRIFATGQNLWETTNLHFSLDPEGLTKDPDANTGSVGLGTSYPVQRIYSFGLELKF